MTPTHNPESEMTPEKARAYIQQETALDEWDAIEISKRWWFLKGVSYQEEKAWGLEEALRLLIFAVEMDSKENNSISGFTGARLSDAKETLYQYQSSSNARQAEGE